MRCSVASERIARMAEGQKIRGALYARGYLISRRDVSDAIAVLRWEKLAFGAAGNRWFLFYDGRNEVCTRESDGRFALVLGTVLDPEKWTLEQGEIVGELLARAGEKEQLLDYIDTLCGRHVIVMGDASGAKLVQDACGMRTCYYGEEFVASHYGLINDLERHAYVSFWSAYNVMPDKPWYLPGAMTPFENVLTLFPNHALDLCTHRVERIFPRCPREAISAPEVADYFAGLLRTQVEVLSRKYKFLVSTTGGHDSRVTLSALKSHRDRALLFSYLNQSKTDTCAYDNVVARQLAGDFGFAYRQLVLDKPAPAALSDILLRNHYHRHVPSAIPKYVLELPCEGALHLRSNILEIIRERGYFRLKPCTAEAMAAMTYGGTRKMGSDPDVLKAFSEFFRNNEYDRLQGYDAGDVFYQELRMGVWHAGGILLASDLAFDTYCLFNQRKFLDMGMRMPERFRRSNYLVDEVIKRLWPEMSSLLPNSSETLLDLKSPFSKLYCPAFIGAEATSQDTACTTTLAPDFAEVAFASGDIKEGSFVGVRLSFDKIPVGSGVTVVMSFLPLEAETAGAFSYRVLINGEPRISESVASLDDGYAVLQVGPKEGESVSSVEVQVVATKDFSCLDAVPVMRLANWRIVKGKVQGLVA